MGQEAVLPSGQDAQGDARLTEPDYVKSREAWRDFCKGRISAAELEQRVGANVGEEMPKIIKDLFTSDPFRGEE